jgi:uncharacterized protein YndB with AHSA1/START domain
MRATMELHDDRSLVEECLAVRRELVLPFPRDEAWPLLGEPEELETWYAEEVDLEIREGARGTVRLAEGERDAVVEEVVPGRRLALRLADPDDPDAGTLVELTLDDVADGTRLVVVELPLRALPAAPAAPPATPQLSAVLR